MNEMETKRKYILRIHGTLLILVGIAASINATLGAGYGMGSYTFLQHNEVGYIGLLQAYLLALLTGIVLWTGSYADNRKKWNRIGCLFHFFLLMVYAICWNFFPTLPGGEITRNIGFGFHIIFFTIELWAGIISKTLNHD
jgi:hypothetical protein